MSDQLARLAAALADRYRIDRELGAGGMATVYLAEDLKHNRKVAVKVLKPELAVAIGAERFLAEIKTTANLQHPHILALHDSGEVNGTVFYVMPYVEGESLRDRLDREKQLPIDDALRIAGEVADALQYAHERGVIHRDIKPENILLQRGHAVVADFGIALAASKTGGTRMTETGMSLGTPTYMSPEQAMGAREVDARTDVYSLGCVLYEMLAGEPPFVGPTAQSIVAKVITESPKSLTGQRRTVPPHVDATVQTALEKLAADRFATAAAFAESLRNQGASAHRAAHRSAHAGQRSRAVASNALKWAGAALAGAVLIGAGAFLFVPREPLVADASTDAVPGAELRHRKPVAQCVLNELKSLFHRDSLQPGHRQSSLNGELPCSLEGVLPMLPDRSVTHVPGLYPPVAEHTLKVKSDLESYSFQECNKMLVRTQWLSVLEEVKLDGVVVADHAASKVPTIPTIATSPAPGTANRIHRPNDTCAPARIARSAPLVGIIMSTSPAPV